MSKLGHGQSQLWKENELQIVCTSRNKLQSQKPCVHLWSGTQSRCKVNLTEKKKNINLGWVGLPEPGRFTTNQRVWYIPNELLLCKATLWLGTLDRDFSSQPKSRSSQKIQHAIHSQSRGKPGPQATSKSSLKSLGTLETAKRCSTLQTSRCYFRPSSRKRCSTFSWSSDVRMLL